MRFPQPNDSQLQALLTKISTNNGVSGIQGPPGTGKSIVGAYLAVLKAYEGKKVLCLAYQNESIDQLSFYIISLLLQTGHMLELPPRSSFCRVGYSPSVSTGIMPYFCGWRGAEEKKIVATTTYSSRHLPKFVNRGFNTLITEESGQIPSHQAWITLENISQQFDCIVTIGDDKQIFPQSPNFTKEPSILFNLRRTDPTAIDMLEITYRLPEPGLTMTSSLFYEGKLRAPVHVMNRRLKLQGSLERNSYGEALNPENSLFYLGVTHDQEEWRGNSYLNRAQADVALRLVSMLLRNGYPANQIVLMAPYRGQRQYLRRKLREYDFPVSCSTVHEMLGREKNVVILTITRSNYDCDIGFLRSQPEILNVGTTRHRCKHIIVGDCKDTFSDGSRYSKAMYEFMERQGLTDYVDPPYSI